MMVPRAQPGSWPPEVPHEHWSPQAQRLCLGQRGACPKPFPPSWLPPSGAPGLSPGPRGLATLGRLQVLDQAHSLTPGLSQNHSDDPLLRREARAQHRCCCQHAPGSPWKPPLSLRRAR